eukprot:SAG31_NODE_18051_length_648_cov_1.224044_1_plen_47_part_10
MKIEKVTVLTPQRLRSEPAAALVGWGGTRLGWLSVEAEHDGGEHELE